MATRPHYFTEFVVVKQLWGPPRFQNLLLIVYDHTNMICAIIQQVFGQNIKYGDGAGNTIEENSSVFSLIQMR